VFGTRSLYNISWEACDADGDELAYTVLFSSDGGGNWQTLGLDLTTKSFNWNVSELTPGNNYLVKVIASDGVNTKEDLSDAPFTVLRPAQDKKSAISYVKAGLQGLKNSVNSYPGISPKMKESLLAKLESCKKKLDQALDWIDLHQAKSSDNMLSAAENIMRSFINEINAQRSKGIEEIIAKTLELDARSLIEDIEVLKNIG
jgi:hypothetical protein